jgi:ribonuclease VapC
MSEATVLDASALLALLAAEPGAERVADLLPRAAISAVNLGETVSSLVNHGVPGVAAARMVGDLAIETHALDESMAIEAGMLREATRAFGLSFGDRACLCLGRRLGRTIVTADRAWARLRLPGVAVSLLR